MRNLWIPRDDSGKPVARSKESLIAAILKLREQQLKAMPFNALKKELKAQRN